MNVSSTNQLFFYGGVSEIGGNKIYFESSKHKGIFLDFGWPFTLPREYLDQYLKLRKYQYLYDAIQIQELPIPHDHLTGLYRNDLYTYIENEMGDMFGITPQAPTHVTDVLISHAHLDHVGEIPFLHPNIRLNCSATTQLVLNSLQKTYNRPPGFCQVLSYTPYDNNKLQISRDIQITSQLQEFSIGANSISGWYMETDHSLPGAGAYLLQDRSSRLKLIYTGDIRFHGPLQNQAEKFLESAAQFKPDVLLCEGTRLIAPSDEETSNNGSIPNSEERVLQQLKSTLQMIHTQDPNKLVCFDCAARDVWRLRSFYQAALQSHRKLVLDPNSYVILKDCHQAGIIPDLDLQKVYIYLAKKGKGDYAPKDYTKSPAYVETTRSPDISPDSVKYKYQMLDLTQPHLIRSEAIHAHPEKYLLQLSFYKFTNFFDIRPPSGSYFIFSKSEPYDEEGYITYQKVQNWLAWADIPDDHQFRFHCSGHACQSDLERMIREIHPKKLFPIHTEAPKAFQHLDIPNDIEIILPKRKEGYSL